MKTSSDETLKFSSLWGLSCALTLGLGATLSGCYVETQPVAVSGGVYASAGTADGTVYPAEPPPDPIPESAPPAPGAGYVWANGNWDWTGSEWTWSSGYWAPQQPGYVYIGPRFEFVEGRPVYYRSYWQGPGGRREYGYGGRGAPPAAWRARPASDPVAWRGEPAHNQAWHSSPGADKWHGSATAGREPARNEPARTEPARNEPARAEPARTEPARNEPARTEPARTEPARTEPMRAEPGRTEAEHGLATAKPGATPAAAGAPPGAAVRTQPAAHASATASAGKGKSPHNGTTGEKKKAE